jgi:hypothetical protein
MSWVTDVLLILDLKEMFEGRKCLREILSLQFPPCYKTSIPGFEKIVKDRLTINLSR